MNILFVCTGNTCRSPMAEGLFKKIVKENEDEFEIASGGMNAFEGDKANQNAVYALEEYGVDISSHRAKNVDAATIADADIILTMTGAHKEMLLYLFGGAAEVKTHTIMEYIGEDGDIEDPYGGDICVYKKCADKIYNALCEVYKIVGREFDV